ncbi:hypothetical protein [Virgibacillus sp. MG-45]|uniref:hypothetical protein n=1 Tax=Virgibacillus sp. MG-45 TaxID=3102791 RepID=UPI002ED7AC64
MKTVKIIIFFIGIFLINYVGGVPHDARNLFITHTIFVAPYLVDFHRLLSVKTFLKFFIIPVFIAGIIVLMLNILGVAGILIVNHEEVVTFSSNYIPVFSLEFEVSNYLKMVSIVYAMVFTGTITMMHNLNESYQIEKKQSGKELAKSVHT